jgi:hypothetical protein
MRYHFQKWTSEKVTSGLGARKRRRYICFDQPLFFLPKMQERDISDNITPPPTATESTAQDMTGNQMGEGSHAKNVIYRQQKKRFKTTYEEFLLEIIKEKSRDDIDEDKIYLMSLVTSFKKLNEEQKFIAIVEFLNFMRRITFCQPHYHVSNPPQFPFYCNLPGPSAHDLYTRTLPSLKIPPGTHHKFCSDLQHQHNQSLQNPYYEFTPCQQHSTSTGSSTPLLHVTL